MNPVIETVAIGDEILAGKISDTNSTFVANALFESGLLVSRQSVIADDAQAIQETLETCSRRCDVAIVFGGLGPTSDDKTAECVAAFLGSQVVVHEPSRERLVKFYQERNRPIRPESLKQVYYPDRSEPMLNHRGMAPGFRHKSGRCQFYYLPGVPEEMKDMFRASVLPHLGKGLGEKNVERILTHTWKCLGIFESELQGVMNPVEADLPKGAWLGYRTRFPENHLSLYLRAHDSESEGLFEQCVSKIRSILQPWAYTEGDLELEEIVLNELKKRRWNLALAESCTGGLVGQRLTRVAGSSDAFWGGATVYQVGAKDKLLGVRVNRPEEAVSKECTLQLARRALEVSGCELSAAITGYMGPDGGTAENPLGTIFFAVHGKEMGKDTIEQRMVLTVRDRHQTQWGAATHLLNAIRSYLAKH